MNAATRSKLENVFRAVFELAPDTDVSRVRQISEPRWDSLAHVSLVAAVESEFNLNLDAADSLRITSFQATQLLLDEKGL